MLNFNVNTLSAHLPFLDGPGDDPAAADRELSHRLYETFEEEMAASDVSGLHFYTRDGCVTIYGTVKHELDRDLIITIVRQISGVNEVKNNLQLAS